MLALSLSLSLLSATTTTMASSHLCHLLPLLLCSILLLTHPVNCASKHFFHVFFCVFFYIKFPYLGLILLCILLCKNHILMLLSVTLCAPQVENLLGSFNGFFFLYVILRTQFRRDLIWVFDLVLAADLVLFFLCFANGCFVKYVPLLDVFVKALTYMPDQICAKFLQYLNLLNRDLSFMLTCAKA